MTDAADALSPSNPSIKALNYRAAAANHRFPLAAVYVAVVAILSCIAVGINIHRAKHDYHIWFDAGQHLLHGKEIYDVRPGQQLEFMYPPTAAYLLAPTTIAGEQVMTAILAIANSLSLGIVVLLSVYLATGHARNQAPVLYLLPAALAMPHVWEMYVLGQPNLFLLALMLGGFACLQTRRPVAAGLLIALAAAVKAFPVTALGYLLYRRYWTASIAMVGGLALYLVIIPAPFRGPGRAVHDLELWASQMVRVDDQEIGQRAERSYSWQNQSLLGVVHRYLRHLDANRSRQGEYYINFANLSARQANLAVLIIGGAIGLAYIWLLPPIGRQMDQTRSLEWGMLLILMLLASPYYFSYYSVWLIFPYTLLVDAAGRALAEGRKPWIAAGALVICAIVFVLSVQYRGFWYFQFLGNVLWGDLVLLAALGVELHRRNRLNQRPAPTATAPAGSALGSGHSLAVPPG